MGKFYSAATNAFFDDAIHTTMPDDAVPISDKRHRELLAAQADGKTIGATAEGKPTAAMPRITLREARDRAVRSVKREAARRIENIAPLSKQMNLLRSEFGAADAVFVLIDRVRAASNEIEAAIATMSSVELAAFDVAGDARWPSTASN